MTYTNYMNARAGKMDPVSLSVCLEGLRQELWEHNDTLRGMRACQGMPEQIITDYEQEIAALKEAIAIGSFSR